jgi:hypothetical protein
MAIMTKDVCSIGYEYGKMTADVARQIVEAFQVCYILNPFFLLSNLEVASTLSRLLAFATIVMTRVTSWSRCLLLMRLA